MVKEEPATPDGPVAAAASVINTTAPIGNHATYVRAITNIKFLTFPTLLNFVYLWLILHLLLSCFYF